MHCGICEMGLLFTMIQYNYSYGGSSMAVADVLVPIWHQDICNHDVDIGQLTCFRSFQRNDIEDSVQNWDNNSSDWFHAAHIQLSYDLYAAVSFSNKQ